jgi:hypothetical protein
VRADGRDLPVVARLDTLSEREHYRHGGILPFVVESSVFYGKNAFFIPVHQNLNNNDFNYFFNLMKYFLRHISHDNKKI